MWLLVSLQGFPLIWPGDLGFDPKWPSFKLNLEIKTNILSKIHDDCSKSVASIECEQYFPMIWTGDLGFDPQVNQFRTWPRFHRGKHSEHVSSRLVKNCDL